MNLLCWYKRYTICLISFFSLYELFSAFIYANNTGGLVNSLFGVNIFIIFPSFTFSSSPSGGSMGCISTNYSSSNSSGAMNGVLSPSSII